MDRRIEWIGCILMLVTAQAVLAQDDEEELLPPLINKDEKLLKYFMLDEPVEMDCKAEGTEPITYEWEKVEFDDAGARNVLQKYSEDPANAIVEESKLTFELAQITDEGIYQCRATNDQGVSLSNNFVLKRARIRKAPGSDTAELTAEEGKPFTIPCTPLDPPSIPRAINLWTFSDGTKKGDPLLTSERIAFDDMGNLHFAHVLPEDDLDGKLYMCNHRNTEIDATIGGNEAKLTVTPVDDAPDFKPELVYSTKQKSEGDDNTYTLIAGRDARIQCIFSGKPAPAVTWEFTDSSGSKQPIPSVLNYGDLGQTVLVHNSKTVLTESDATPPDGGVLRCKASNSLGEASHEIPLKIEYSPRLIVPPSPIKVQAGETTNLVCAADGYPTPEVKWIVNGEDLDASNPGARRSVSDGVIDWEPYSADNSKQIILTVSEACNADDCEGGRDIFTVQCNASNIHGSVMGSGYVAVFGEPAVAAVVDEDDPNACKDPETIEAVEKCRSKYNDDAKSNLCLAYCHYNVCITDLELQCTPKSIGKLEFCNNYCIREGLFASPQKADEDEDGDDAGAGDGGDKKDCKRDCGYWGMCRKTVLIICIIFIVLPLIIAIVVVYKLYQRKKERRERKKYRPMSNEKV